MNTALLELFLGYCEHGIGITYKENEEKKYIELIKFDYQNNSANYIITNKINNEKFKVPNIDDLWKLEEYDEYIRIYNDDNCIYIEELI